MTVLVLGLDAIRRHDVALAGGKAAVLGTLVAEGFPVPPALCITTAAFTLALAPYRSRIAAIAREHDLDEPAQATAAATAIAAVLQDLAVPEPVTAALHAALPAVAADTTPVAVRSSATDEDGAAVSFAGQYETVLGVRGEAAIEEAVLTCWRSFYHANALAARARAEAGGAGRDDAMAVLVQQMIDAECAGVCFTLDPVHPERGTIVVDAAWGLGAGTVDGSVATDTAWLIRVQPNRIEDRRVVEKPERWALDPAGGVRREAVADDRKQAACLPEPWLNRVVEFAVTIETLLGCPQDIEWAIADARVHILQSRPITTLSSTHAKSWDVPAEELPEGDRSALWRLYECDREIPPTPLETDGSQLSCQAQADASPFNAWDGWPRLRVIEGRRYVTFVPSDLSAGDRRVRKQAQRAMAARLREEGKTLWDHWAPEIKAAVARLRAFDAEGADNAAVAEHLEDALGAFRFHWMLHWCLWADWSDPPPHLRAFQALTGLEGDEAERGLMDCAGGEETILTHLVDRLYELGQVARMIPEVCSALAAAPASAWPALAALPAAAAFRERLAAFLDEYGDHMGMGYGSEGTIRRPTWREDPSPVLTMLTPYLRDGVVAPAEARRRARAERDARVERLCAACDDPEKVAEFRRWLPVARREARVLEEHNYWIDQTSAGQLRTAISAAAQRLVAAGALAAEDDIYWLHVPEILAALRAEAVTPQHALVAERQTEAAVRQGRCPPPLLGRPQAVLSPRPPLKDEVTAGHPPDATILTGVGASAGKRRGRARVVPMTTVMPAIEPGDVLVAINAGPAWTPVFPLLGALVLDEGSFSQHGATTAREYGVPAVIRTRSATRRIPDGAWVTVDGEAGSVAIE